MPGGRLYYAQRKQLCEDLPLMMHENVVHRQLVRNNRLHRGALTTAEEDRCDEYFRQDRKYRNHQIHDEVEIGRGGFFQGVKKPASSDKPYRFFEETQHTPPFRLCSYYIVLWKNLQEYLNTKTGQTIVRFYKLQRLL